MPDSAVANPPVAAERIKSDRDNLATARAEDQAVAAQIASRAEVVAECDALLVDDDHSVLEAEAMRAGKSAKPGFIEATVNSFLGKKPVPRPERRVLVVGIKAAAEQELEELRPRKRATGDAVARAEATLARDEFLGELHRYILEELVPTLRAAEGLQRERARLDELAQRGVIEALPGLVLPTKLRPVIDDLFAGIGWLWSWTGRTPDCTWNDVHRQAFAASGFHFNFEDHVSESEESANE